MGPITNFVRVSSAPLKTDRPNWNSRMKFSLPLYLTTLIVSLAVLSFAGAEVEAQERFGQNWFGEAHSRSTSNVQSLYDSNSQRPLGGLFAPGFTRTITILGGLNFPSGATTEQFISSIAATPDDPGLLPTSLETGLDDSGYALSFAFGRRHSNALRSEIEVAFRSNDINSTFNGDDSTEVRDGRVNATSLMKNFIIDLSNGTRFTPYVGAGLGISYLDVESGEATSAFAIDEGQTLFSYQAIGGVATQLTSVADFIVEYRFLGTSDVEFEEFGQELSYNTSTLFLGVKLEY